MHIRDSYNGTAVERFLDASIMMLAFAAIMVNAGIRMLRGGGETEGSCSTDPGRSFLRHQGYDVVELEGSYAAWAARQGSAASAR